jgi:hypothetical protein
VLAGILGAAFAGLVVQPALGASAAVSAVATSSLVSGGSGSSWVEPEPSNAELQRQRATVARLQAAMRRQAAGVHDAQQAVQAAAVLAGQALEASAIAVRALQVLQATEQQRQDALTQAEELVAHNRRELGQWARAAYQGGTALGGNPTVTTLLQARNSDDLSSNLAVLRRLGRERGQALVDVEVTQHRADVAAEAAAAASGQAADAAVQATAARQDADGAVNTQRRLLGIAESSLAQTTNDAGAATRRQAELRAGAVLAAAQRVGSGVIKDNRVTGAVGSCRGAGVEQYPNGRIPLAALCPLRAAAGRYLRADAAYAFDRLTEAYAVQFGTAPCITDSYRSYPEQVSVYARKPNLAAIPGTSNHGWGTALDLCGGIERFGSAQHVWMLLNAPLYGWFHPGWAQQTGSKPEPWHWEFSG